VLNCKVTVKDVTCGSRFRVSLIDGPFLTSSTPRRIGARLDLDLVTSY
jgi:hypothetical protein